MKYGETIKNSEYLYRGKIINLRKDVVILPNNKESYREIVEHQGGATCLVLTDDQKLIFVRQYRSAYQEEVLELPAGKLETKETPETTIIRELQEEAGIIPLKLEKVGHIYPSPGYSNEVIHLFFTSEYRRTKRALDEDEFLDTLEIPIREAYQMLEQGKIFDAKTICLLLLMKDRLVKGD
ncbi:MAG: NUDIX hydrolase [Bacilli bacterium]|nr:NUDIX hydrolase [Bacilli bacterium]